MAPTISYRQSLFDPRVINAKRLWPVISNDMFGQRTVVWIDQPQTSDRGNDFPVKQDRSYDGILS